MALLIVLLIATSCHQKGEHAGHDRYTCPMHPSVIQDKPGTCPICGMDLVRKGQPGPEVKITAGLNYLLKPTNALVISSIKTVMPVQKAMEVTTKANGIITYDTRRVTSVPIRFAGRIEKLSIKYNFQPVQKGQKILEIYSPELVTVQRDLLYLQKSDKGNLVLIEGAKEKLRLLGIADSQISELISAGQEVYSFPVYSPVKGYVVEEAASRSGNELRVREGMYVSAGQTIFRVINTEAVWAEFNVYQRDAAFVKVNDPVRLTLDNPSETREATVNFVQPFFKSGERFANVRVYLSNAGNKFKIGQLLTASFNKPATDSIWIPLSATLDLGAKEIAFYKRRGVFRPMEIVTARRSGGWIEVIRGLAPTDSLAYNAQFMVDSESFIKVRN
jgi:multidrug efflux pump subunit AcrA (membrane-fusion protein)